MLNSDEQIMSNETYKYVEIGKLLEIICPLPDHGFCTKPFKKK